MPLNIFLSFMNIQEHRFADTEDASNQFDSFEFLQYLLGMIFQDQLYPHHKARIFSCKIFVAGTVSISDFQILIYSPTPIYSRKTSLLSPL